MKWKNFTDVNSIEQSSIPLQWLKQLRYGITRNIPRGDFKQNRLFVHLICFIAVDYWREGTPLSSALYQMFCTIVEQNNEGSFGTTRRPGVATLVVYVSLSITKVNLLNAAQYCTSIKVIHVDITIPPIKIHQKIVWLALSTILEVCVRLI